MCVIPYVADFWTIFGLSDSWDPKGNVTVCNRGENQGNPLYDVTEDSPFGADTVTITLDSYLTIFVSDL